MRRQQAMLKPTDVQGQVQEGTVNCQAKKHKLTAKYVTVLLVEAGLVFVVDGQVVQKKSDQGYG